MNTVIQTSSNTMKYSSYNTVLYLLGTFLLLWTEWHDSYVTAFVTPHSTYRNVLPAPLNNRKSFCTSSKSNAILSRHQTLFMSSEKEAEKVTTKLPPYPKIGDIVRYVDLDGGRNDGQVLVGKIALIQPVFTSNPNDEKQWLLEIAELDNMGDGYYGDYPMRERRFKRALRKLPDVSPILASFVRSADAYKVPLDENKQPKAWYEQYRLDGYEGPSVGNVNQEIVQSDGERYNDLKWMLLKDSAIVGAVGALIAQIAYGSDEALIYAAGAAAGVGYLFFLSVKTDTLGSPGSKFGNNISNIRFALPIFVLLGVAIRNIFSGVDDVGFNTGGNILSTVTKEQFGAAMLGFLTYRVPLFLRQLQPVIGDSVTEMLPGSAGLAMQMAQSAAGQDTEELVASPDSDLTTVLLICGPSGTGKSTLVKKLLSGDTDGRFVEPEWIDRNLAGARFEVMERRGEFLKKDPSGRYALSKESVLTAASNTKENKQVVVVDADVELAKRLAALTGTRIVGVWVGLDSIDKIQNRIRLQMEAGEISIPPNETEDSILRSRVKQIVKDIEYGVISGIFEFTILNDDLDQSVKELKAAAEYCFK